MRFRLAHPRRYDNLRRIDQLDPAVDHDEIIGLTAYHEFPWEYVQGTSIAFMRDYGVPSISDLLDRTGRFEHEGQKRYDDTVLIGQESVAHGIDSPRGHAAVRHLNGIHGHYASRTTSSATSSPPRWSGRSGSSTATASARCTRTRSRRWRASPAGSAS